MIDVILLWLVFGIPSAGWYINNCLRRSCREDTTVIVVGSIALLLLGPVTITAFMGCIVWDEMCN